jgi:competence protein ComEC
MTSYGEKDLKTDILKIGHHGSKYSTSEDFLRVAGPEVAVISVGANYFGHPSERVIEIGESTIKTLPL